MKPAAYRLLQADTIEQGAALLTECGWGGKPVAGGQSLGAMLNLRLAHETRQSQRDGIQPWGVDIDQRPHVLSPDPVHRAGPFPVQPIRGAGGSAHIGVWRC